MKSQTLIYKSHKFAFALKAYPLYNQLAAIFLLAAFFAQCFGRSFIVVDYYANTDAYAKNCVNKAKPRLKCNGKCQMMKKLEQEEKKDADNPERKSTSGNEVLLSSKSFFAIVDLPSTELISSKQISYYPGEAAIDRCTDVFHPPKYT